MLTEHLPAQAGPSGVRVNCLAPETILRSDASERHIGGATGTGVELPAVPPVPSAPS
jgi:NAD(P)-dependent dehydrogenase (short-subunit alcohol dehydrogenase family)